MSRYEPYPPAPSRPGARVRVAQADAAANRYRMLLTALIPAAALVAAAAAMLVQLSGA
jgi:hypothetical protein